MIEEPKMCFISYIVGVIYSFFMTLICSPLPQYFIIVFYLFFVSLFLFICLFVFFLFLSFILPSFLPSFLPFFLPSFLYLFIYLFIYYLLFLFSLHFTFILPVKSGLVYRITQWRLWVTQEPEDCIMNWSRQSA